MIVYDKWSLWPSLMLFERHDAGNRSSLFKRPKLAPPPNDANELQLKRGSCGGDATLQLLTSDLRIPNPTNKLPLKSMGLNLPMAPLVLPLKRLQDYSALKETLNRKVSPRTVLARPKRLDTYPVPDPDLLDEVKELGVQRDAVKVDVERLRHALATKRVAKQTLLRRVEEFREKLELLKGGDAEIAALKEEMRCLRNVTEEMYTKEYDGVKSESQALVDSNKNFRYSDLVSAIETLDERKQKLHEKVLLRRSDVDKSVNEEERLLDKVYLESVEVPHAKELATRRISLMEREQQIAVEEARVLDIEQKLQQLIVKRQDLTEKLSQIKLDDGGYDKHVHDLKMSHVGVDAEVTAVDKELSIIMKKLDLVQIRHTTAMNNAKIRLHQLRWIEFQIGEYRKCVRVIAVCQSKSIKERSLIVGKRQYMLTQVVDAYDVDVIRCLVEKAAAGRDTSIGIYGLLVRAMIESIQKVYQDALPLGKTATKSLEHSVSDEGLDFVVQAEGAGRLRVFEFSSFDNLKSLASQMSLTLVVKIEDDIPTTMLDQLAELAVTPNIF